MALLSSSIVASAAVDAEPLDTLPDYGMQHRSSQLFRTYYKSGDLTNYLDNLDDYTTYQTETTGGFAAPDRLTFSVAGNSYRWNRFYLDGFRIDSRFMPGSTTYHVDMLTHSLDIDYHTSQLWLTKDAAVPDAITATYNFGGLGGISRGTKQFINLLHLTAQERAYKPMEHRNKMQGLGSVDLNYTLRRGGTGYRQHLYFDYGVRKLVDFDETGIDDYYPEDFFELSLDGQLPVKPVRLFDTMNYIIGVSGRSNMGSEFYYGREETAQQNTYSLSLYGTRRRSHTRYTSGLTLAFNTVRHDDLGFSRNLIDQDGEGFEPWQPDGVTSELSYALNLEHRINSWLSFTFDGYNSVMHFAPRQNSFSNAVYLRQVGEPFTPLYVYDWSSEAFASGLLENTASLRFHRRLARWLDFKANILCSGELSIYQGKDGKTAYGHYLETIYREMTWLTDFDIIGHFDYVARYAPYPECSIFYRDFPDIFDSILGYLAGNGKALEINTKTYQDYSGRTPVLDKDILLRFRELGGEAVSLGSDSHFPERVGDKFRLYSEFIKACGFKYTAHFSRRKLILGTI